MFRPPSALAPTPACCPVSRIGRDLNMQGGAGGAPPPGPAHRHGRCPASQDQVPLAHETGHPTLTCRTFIVLHGQWLSSPLGLLSGTPSHRAPFALLPGPVNRVRGRESAAQGHGAPWPSIRPPPFVDLAPIPPSARTSPCVSPDWAKNQLSLVCPSFLPQHR